LVGDALAGQLGRGTDDGVEVGLLVDRPAPEKVAELVDDAVHAGAAVATGGHVVDRPEPPAPAYLNQSAVRRSTLLVVTMRHIP
jgi:acyl-CoA reductase-like NAD-dependent aldehyde dehydrogenase